MVRAACILLPGLLLLAGCGGTKKEAAAPMPVDAAVSDALADPIMTDPDLASQNEAHAAVAVSGPASSALPPIDRSDAAIDAARESAARLAGGTIPAVPSPAAAELKPLREAATAAQMAVAARISTPACIANLQYTARWAAALVAPLDIYPRGAVEEAAGTDAAGCALRVVHFKTPVAPGDVLGFYHARLRAAGYPVEHGVDGEDHLLRGNKGSARYALYLRKAEDGLTAVDVLVSG